VLGALFGLGPSGRNSAPLERLAGTGHQRGPCEWNLTVLHIAFLAIRVASIGCDSTLLSSPVKVAPTFRASTFAALAGTAIQFFLSRPFVGNGSSFRKRFRPKTAARPVKALRSTYAPYVPSIVSLGTDHTAQGINFAPCAFPVVTEATEPYCFSTPAERPLRAASRDRKIISSGASSRLAPLPLPKEPRHCLPAEIGPLVTCRTHLAVAGFQGRPGQLVAWFGST
jgi:hypothetical protein